MTSVKVIPQQGNKRQLVQVISTSKSIDKADAVKSLGKDAKKYVVRSWAKRE